MEQGLTSQETLLEVQKLLDLCFSCNSILDNIVYQLNIAPLNMPNIYKFLHFTISHSFSGNEFADGIGDFMMQRNDKLTRNVVPAHNRIYNNLVECLEDVTKCFNDVKNQVEIIIDIAIKNTKTDKEVEDYFRDLNIKNVILFWKQAQNLLNGAQQYASSGILPLFNRDYKKYIILPDELIKYN